MSPKKALGFSHPRGHLTREKVMSQPPSSGHPEELLLMAEIRRSPVEVGSLSHYL